MLSISILFYIIKVIDDTDLCPSSKIHLPAELQQLGSAGVVPGLDTLWTLVSALDCSAGGGQDVYLN